MDSSKWRKGPIVYNDSKLIVGQSENRTYVFSWIHSHNIRVRSSFQKNYAYHASQASHRSGSPEFLGAV